MFFAPTIRKASKDDTEELRHLCIETFYNRWKSTNTEDDLQIYIKEHFSYERILGDLSNKDVVYLVAELNEQFVGYTKLNKNKSDGDLGNLKAIEIQRMYVLDGFVGKNIGTNLMNAALNLAKDELFEVAWLGVWDENVLAVKFYKNFGFVEYGEHDFILGNDITTDILMKKYL